MEYTGVLDGRCCRWVEYVYQEPDSESFMVFDFSDDRKITHTLKIKECIRFWAHTVELQGRFYLNIFLVPTKYTRTQTMHLIGHANSHYPFPVADVNERILKAIYG